MVDGEERRERKGEKRGERRGERGTKKRKGGSDGDKRKDGTERGSREGSKRRNGEEKTMHLTPCALATIPKFKQTSVCIGINQLHDWLCEKGNIKWSTTYVAMTTTASNTNCGIKNQLRHQKPITASKPITGSISIDSFDFTHYSS